MEYTILPVTDSPRQIILLPVSPNGRAFQARVELRYLAAAGLWFLSLSDAVTGALYVNQIPVVCSYEEINDLLAPFRWMFQGTGLGSLFCVKAADRPGSENPGEHNLNKFYLIWGDTWKT